MNKTKLLSRKLVFFLLTLLAISCSKETMTDEIDKLDQSKTGTTKKEGEIDYAMVNTIKLQADEKFNYLKSFQTKLKSAAATPIYVGVLPNSGTCPAGVNQIIWWEDLEDDGPITKYEHAGCFKTGGLQVDNLGGNAKWVVCIVDAYSYNFSAIKYGYGVFALSAQQFYNNSDEASIFIDDENSSNGDNFQNPTYGFVRNPNSPYYPTQNNVHNTIFSLYYFKPVSTSTTKLPNLGFSYSIFSNFSCCDWTNQNTVELDAEDSSPSNTITYYPLNQSGYLVNQIDATYGVMQRDKNVRVFIQNADIYRN